MVGLSYFVFLKAKLKMRQITAKMSPPAARTENMAVIQIFTVACTNVGMPSYGIFPSETTVLSVKIKGHNV